MPMPIYTSMYVYIYFNVFFFKQKVEIAGAFHTPPGFTALHIAIVKHNIVNNDTGEKN